MAAITQGLRELGAADACQPTADVIAICQCVCAAAVQFFGRHTTLVVVSVACQGHCGIVVQLMRNSTDTVGMVVGIGVHFRSRSLSRSRVFMGHSERLVSKAIGGGRHVIAPKQIALYLPGQPAPDVIIVSRMDLVDTAKDCHYRACQPAPGIA